MSELKDLKKEELIQLATDISGKLQIAETQIISLDQFYKNVFVSEDQKVSYKTQFENLLNNITSDLSGLSKIKSDLQGYTNELLIGNEGNESIKLKIENTLKGLEGALRMYTDRAKEVSDFADGLFKNEEGKISLKDKIAELKNDLEIFFNETSGADEASATNKIKRILKSFDDSIVEAKNKEGEIITFHKKVFDGDENNQSIAQEIDTFKSELKTYINELLIGNDKNESTKVNIENAKNKIQEFYESSEKLNSKIKEYNRNLLEDDDENEVVSIKSQINKIKLDFSKNLAESSSRLKELKEFYDNVFGTVDEETGIIKSGLKRTVTELEARMKIVIKNAEERLVALTDHSLHNSFARRASEHTAEYGKFQNYTLYSVLAIIGVTVSFGLAQIAYLLSKKGFEWHLVIYQISMTLPLIFVVWMYNRNQKIAKKLAEEYHHKAALAEAMTGYRDLYGLKHNDEEYLSLFNKIKEQLNVNPSTKIDKFLNLKSPQEQIFDNFANPDAIAKFADVLKPYFKKESN